MNTDRLSSSRIIDFQQKILIWYEQYARDLPWRKIDDPYKIRVSETMLCQTQVSRVIGYYEKWIRLFPDCYHLAHTSNQEVLKARSGLGYNSRALRLKKAAGIIRERYGHAFPSTYDQLITLPWVGEYTANAILAFAFNQDVVVIDTKIRRIMLHEFAVWDDKLMEKLQASHRFEQQRLYEIAEQTLPIGKARVRYNALMDYGAMVTTPSYTGIAPRSKQSPFVWSTRQVRADIVRRLLLYWSLTLDQVLLLYPERSDIDKIIVKMIQDTLIIKEGDNLLISK